MAENRFGPVDTILREEWEHVTVPPDLRAAWESFHLVGDDFHILYPMKDSDSFIFWLVGRNLTPPRSRAALAVAVTGDLVNLPEEEMRPRFRELLQSSVDSFQAKATPFEEGGVLPLPVAA
jgi:hypothetical protein